MPHPVPSEFPFNLSGEENLPYNAARDLIGRNLRSGRGNKVAVIDDDGSYTYSELAERVGKCGSSLRSVGIEPGHKVILWLPDSVDFTTAFLGSIQSGIIPIPLSTSSTVADMMYYLTNSEAQAAIVSDSLSASFAEAVDHTGWRGLTLLAEPGDGKYLSLADLMAQSSATTDNVTTKATDPCFWLYSSGSTGKPKGVVHLHKSMALTAVFFGQGVLGLNEQDLVYSAARLSFAYGLGNALVFPMAVGATTILSRARFAPQRVVNLLRERKPTIFCAVPSLFNSLLAAPDMLGRDDHALRLCVSAGEALPASVGLAWRDRTGVDVLDGIGSTEMLHIFVSNRPGSVKYGTTGVPVAGYRVRLVDESDMEVPAGEIGELQVSGPTAASHYWRDEEATRKTFHGDWVKTGDKFRHTPEGDLVYCGRTDDMLKIDGMWVSPLEVESALLTNDLVLEAAVVNCPDQSGISRVKAFIVLKDDSLAGPETQAILVEQAKAQLARHKCPQLVEFVPSLPKTATGKVRRKVLRDSQTPQTSAAGRSA